MTSGTGLRSRRVTQAPHVGDQSPPVRRYSKINPIFIAIEMIARQRCPDHHVVCREMLAFRDEGSLTMPMAQGVSLEGSEKTLRDMTDNQERKSRLQKHTGSAMTRPAAASRREAPCRAKKRHQAGTPSVEGRNSSRR